MKTALIHGTLLDGNGNRIEDSVIMVEDKKITYAGALTDFCRELGDAEDGNGVNGGVGPLGCDARELGQLVEALRAEGQLANQPGFDLDNYPFPICFFDITGKTVMPGLIDTHLHFSGNLTDDDSDWVLEDPIQKTVVAVQQAHECLESGLTTVGEISRSGIHIRNMVEAGVMQGPRIVATGLGFARTCGHGDSHRLPSWYNEQSHPWAERVDGPWELRKAVRRRLRENPDAIKIWSTGGGIWRWDQKLHQHYTLEEIQAVVDECNMVGIPVWSHAEGYEGALDSCKAGVHLIIHGQTLNDQCLDLMAEKGIYFCPTIQFLQEWFKTYQPPYIPEVHDHYPGDTVAEKELNRVYDNLRRAKEKGIVLTIGSDSFCSSLTPYGATAIGEMVAFVEKAGLSPMDAITAATKNGAEMLKVADVTGTLEAGKYADLLVIDGDPLVDIRCIDPKRMTLIMKEGEIVQRRYTR